jgi:hypothetical protein
MLFDLFGAKWKSASGQTLEKLSDNMSALNYFLHWSAAMTLCGSSKLCEVESPLDRGVLFAARE